MAQNNTTTRPLTRSASGPSSAGDMAGWSRWCELNQPVASGPKRWRRATRYSPSGSGFPSRPAGPASARQCLSCSPPRGLGCPGEWGPQLFFDDDGALVGNAGWKGRPQEGAAELGYAVAPSRQRRGIATAAVRELVERARQADLRVVFAHTLAEENASTKVLTRCGFTRTAELTDPDEGRVWRWEPDAPALASLNLSPAPRPSGKLLVVPPPAKTIRHVPLHALWPAPGLNSRMCSCSIISASVP